ncbi:MAG: DUF5060 domain-containing protein [Marinoscillum sp.]
MKSINTLIILGAFILQSCGDSFFQSEKRFFKQIFQYQKAEFELLVNEQFDNAYDQEEVAVDMKLTAPSGKEITLPCYYEPNTSTDQSTAFRARFAPAEEGVYTYHFEAKIGEVTNRTADKDMMVFAGESEGFLHVNDYWTLKFDSGKPFRGIGENVGWEARSYEDPKYTYDYLLPTLSQNGANFFRTWMCSWDLPVFWQKIGATDRYQDSDAYFHPQGIEKMDEFINKCDSLGLYVMLAMDTHGALIQNGGWEHNRYNKINGGPAETPTDFFKNKEARKMSKNKFRFLIARWGYSTHLGAWEFFNEIDNSAFTRTPHDSIRIPHKYITDWHEEMSAYIKAIDPYGHIVTTSVSHREIEGMFHLEDIDIAQHHIYKKTNQIPGLINQYVEEYQKPFVWGEFGYEWDWNLDFSKFAKESDYDYRRGLWYGLFNPTPILPMTWWWEFFDERGMTPYFRGVRQISDEMLEAGNGSFEQVETTSDVLESFAVKCGNKYFVVILNNMPNPQEEQIAISLPPGKYQLASFNPDDLTRSSLGEVESVGKLNLPSVKMQGFDEILFVLSKVSE